MILHFIGGPIDGDQINFDPMDLAGLEFLAMERDPREVCVMPIEMIGKPLPLTTSIYKIRLGPKCKAIFSHYEKRKN